jgi:ABC-type phosphate/phosphonate transport system substrate-binding protein
MSMFNQRMLQILFVLVMSMGLVACGGESQATPTDIVTPSPEVTELPQVPTLAPAGLPGNPLRFVVVPADAETASESKETLENAIVEASSVTVDVVLAANYADALSALCATTPQNVSVAFLDGLTWLAAEARNCGEPVLRLTEGDDDDAISDAVVILLNDEFGTTDLNVLPGRTFCRLGVDDVNSWLLPTLLFRANGIDAATFESIQDYEDADALLTAISDGDCAGGAFERSTYRAWQAEDDTRLDNTRLAVTSVDLPYGVLVYPAQIPLAARLSLTEGLLRFFVTAEDIEPFFGEFGIGRFESDDFADLRTFIDELGLDLALLGQ